MTDTKDETLRQKAQKVADDNHDCPDGEDCWCERATKSLVDDIEALINSEVEAVLGRVKEQLANDKPLTTVNELVNLWETRIEETLEAERRRYQ